MAALSSAPASKDSTQWEAEKAALIKSHAEAIAKSEVSVLRIYYGSDYLVDS